MTATDTTTATPEGKQDTTTVPGTDTNIPTADGQGTTEGATADAETQDKQQPSSDQEQTNVAGEQPYEFTAPEGRELDTDLIEVFEPLARKHGLKQEGAQEIIDAMTPLIGERIVKAVEAGIAEADQSRSDEWADETRKDKEIGGTKLKASLKDGKTFLAQYGDDALTKLLADTGMGSHPALIRAFAKAGKAISEESTFLTGGPGTKRLTEAQLQGSEQQAENLFGE